VHKGVGAELGNEMFMLYNFLIHRRNHFRGDQKTAVTDSDDHHREKISMDGIRLMPPTVFKLIAYSF